MSIINKMKLWGRVNKKIKRYKIVSSDVLAILNILLDEMLIDLKNGKEIKIMHFGTFSLRKTKPRKYFDWLQHKFLISPGYFILRFRLSPKLNEHLHRTIDTQRTFGINDDQQT
jgi:nucleoid DNA-binding protein